MPNNLSVSTQDKIARLELHRNQILQRRYESKMESIRREVIRELDQRIRMLKEKVAA